MEAEILNEALAIANPKKPMLRLSSFDEEGSP
jgi:hypothetical protein